MHIAAQHGQLVVAHGLHHASLRRRLCEISGSSAEHSE
jgi:hypothetical protein